MKQEVPNDIIIVADVTDQYLFPPALAPSDAWPDLVAYSELTKMAIIISSQSALTQTLRKLRRERSINTRNLLWKLKEMISLWTS